jgi:hypothetical protein
VLLLLIDSRAQQNAARTSDINNKGVIDHFEKVTNLYGIREVVIIDSSSDDDVSEGERKRRRMMKQKS